MVPQEGALRLEEVPHGLAPLVLQPPAEARVRPRRGGGRLQRARGLGGGEAEGGGGAERQGGDGHGGAARAAGDHAEHVEYEYQLVPQIG